MEKNTNKEKLMGLLERSEKICYRKLNVSFISLTPDFCEQALDCLPPYQRDSSGKMVRKISRDLAAGDWHDLCDPIRFSDDGFLIDGQHRLRAFLHASVFPTVLVAWGIGNARESYGVLDDGQKRTHSQNFKALGIPNYARASSVAVGRATYDAGLVVSSGLSKQQVVDAYYAHRESILWAAGRWKELDSILSEVMTSLLSSLMYDFYGEGLTIEFFDSMVSGIGKSPPILFRKRLIQNANRSRGRLQRSEVFALGVKAIQAFVDGVDMRQLKWTGDEAFPRLKG
jgi:hypothetical protein